jgi:hypothetical protein
MGKHETGSRPGPLGRPGVARLCFKNDTAIYPRGVTRAHGDTEQWQRENSGEITYTLRLLAPSPDQPILGEWYRIGPSIWEPI